MTEQIPPTARAVGADPVQFPLPAARRVGPSLKAALIDIVWVGVPTALWVAIVEPITALVLLGLGRDEPIPYNFLLGATAVRLCMVGLLLWWRMSLRHQGPAVIGLTARNALGEIGIGIPITFLLLMLSTAATMWLVVCWPELLDDIHQDREAGLALFPPMAAWQWILLPVLIALVEEPFFRGFLQQRLLVICRHPIPAVIVQAALFGAAHFYQGPAAMLGIFYLGVALGWLTWWRRSLLAAITGHALFDIVQFTIVEVLIRPNLPV